VQKLDVQDVVEAKIGCVLLRAGDALREATVQRRPEMIGHEQMVGVAPRPVFENAHQRRRLALRAEALRQGVDLQRAHLAARTARGDQAHHEGSGRCGQT
jgi:hypothetical protein